ncbi:MAG TPA: 3-isopropylmalate dehydratase large subunit [Ktedonobacteraceae bacterium]|nr:3-isopropylmalate dehydratase large subunit [Ktedonobacteraceae bacterium]
MPHTLFEKIWQRHVVRDLGKGWVLLHIDRHLLHDLSGPPALIDLERRRLAVRNPELVFATADHAVSTTPGRSGGTIALGAKLRVALQAKARTAGIRFFDVGEEGQGIVHVIGPEMGLVQPGLTLICGDSHTCTNGGLGALAFGVGSSESAHALATQTVRQHKPGQMRLRFEGQPGQGVTPKDLILYAIGRLGAAAAIGMAIEYAGSTISAMEVEQRLTICNHSVEMGAKYGLIAPDDTTFAYLEGRRFTPQGALFEAAVADWRRLVTDEDAVFDREEVIDAAAVAPTITWGTSPEHVIPIDGLIPDPAAVSNRATREAYQAALAYMGLEPEKPLAGTPIDWIFLGSCANARLSDLREAAELARGRHVAPGVTAWVVPSSESVKRQAEAEGLDRVFRKAGFAWRESGCSLCVAANGERIPPGARVVSTSNRNFVGRQGPGARTHLASPAMAVAAAVTGRITDVRRI